MLCTVKLGGKPFHALLGDRLVEAVSRDATPPMYRRTETLTPLGKGLGTQRVAMELWAGAAEIELGDLQSLKPGDVVVLDMKVDEPMKVAVDGTILPRRAYLGRYGTAGIARGVSACAAP